MTWSQSVFGNADLGDKRRTKRLVNVGAMLSCHPDRSLDGAFGTDRAGAEGAQRLMRNGEVHAQSVFESGAQATVRLAREHEGVLLAVEDTTSLSYSHSVVSELGDLGGPATSKHRGYFVHSILIVDPSCGDLIGLIDQTRWCRTGRRGSRHNRKQRPYEEKESYKWSRGSEGLRKRIDSETLSRVISVCDRESDVWEYLWDKNSHGERFVIRSCWNRSVAGEDAGPLWDVMEGFSILGHRTVDVMARGGRAARRATVAVRGGTVDLRIPSRFGKRGKQTLRLGAVLVREETAAQGVEALEWLLLTSEPVDTFSRAVFVLDCYQRRWLIEEWHKAWKTGCGVERNRQQTASRLELMAVITAFVAVRLLQLKNLSSRKSQASCGDVLASEEWQCLWLSTEKDKRIPKRPPSIVWAYHALGRLGGWHDTQRTGRIGWISLWRGWESLQERLVGFRMALSMKGQNCD